MKLDERQGETQVDDIILFFCNEHAKPFETAKTSFVIGNKFLCATVLCALPATHRVVMVKVAK